MIWRQPEEARGFSPLSELSQARNNKQQHDDDDHDCIGMYRPMTFRRPAESTQVFVTHGLVEKRKESPVNAGSCCCIQVPDPSAATFSLHKLFTC